MTFLLVLLLFCTPAPAGDAFRAAPDVAAAEGAGGTSGTAGALGGNGGEPSSVLHTWGTEAYRLEAGESFQFRIEYKQIPVRRWRLLVEGDHLRCDVSVRRERDGSLLYHGWDESRHAIEVPWGRGEVLSVAVTAREKGVFTIRFLGPPPDAVSPSYGPEVNRALEAYAAGQRDEAERHCWRAVDEGDDAGVARVFLAGLVRDRGWPELAAALLAEALATDLPPEVATLADRLLADLGPGGSAGLPAAPQQAPAAAGLLARGEPAAALEAADRRLREGPEPDPQTYGWLLQVRGEALHALGRHYEAVDALTQALALTSWRPGQASLHYKLGELLADMDNPGQAAQAFATARALGLPAELDRRAAARLADLDQLLERRRREAEGEGRPAPEAEPERR